MQASGVHAGWGYIKVVPRRERVRKYGTRGLALFTGILSGISSLRSTSTTRRGRRMPDGCPDLYIPSVFWEAVWVKALLVYRIAGFHPCSCSAAAPDVCAGSSSV